MSLNEVKWDQIGGVAFDAVGTVIDPCPSVAEVYAEAAMRQGVVLDRGEVKRRFHQFFRVDELDEIKGPLATDEELEVRRWRRIVANVLPEVPDFDRAFAELWEHFGRPEAWRVFDDVAEALADLNACGIPYVLASNFDARLHSVVLGLGPLAHLGSRSVVSSLVGYRKPHPRFYEAVCNELELPPGQILYVGDDQENDVLGPRRAGLQGLRIDRGGDSTGSVGTLRDVARRIPNRSSRLASTRLAGFSRFE